MLRWLKRRRKQRNCMHHTPSSKTSWVSSELLDSGMRKRFWCRMCFQSWFV